MTNEEDKENEDIQNNTPEDAKITGKKSSDAIDKIAEGAKKTSEKAEVAIDNLKEGTKKAGEKAEVVIDNIKEGTKKAGEKAEVVIEDIAEGAKKIGEKGGVVIGSILTGMKKAGDKATDAVKILEIKREISQLESANKKITPQIGNAVLVLYMEKKIKEPTLTAFCEEIEKNNKLIEDKKAQIEVINKSETE